MADGENHSRPLNHVPAHVRGTAKGRDLTDEKIEFTVRHAHTEPPLTSQSARKQSPAERHQNGLAIERRQMPPHHQRIPHASPTICGDGFFRLSGEPAGALAHTSLIEQHTLCMKAEPNDLKCALKSARPRASRCQPACQKQQTTLFTLSTANSADTFC